jgi:hypothetical protein
LRCWLDGDAREECAQQGASACQSLPDPGHEVPRISGKDGFA